MRRLTDESVDDKATLIESPSLSSDEENEPDSCRDSISSEVEIRRRPNMVRSMLQRLRLGQFTGDEVILEDVDLEDRDRLLIPMASFNGPNKHTSSIGGPGTTHLDPHIQNGLNGTSRAMNGGRVEASELAGRPPKEKMAAIHVSRNQLTAALILCLAAIVVAVLVTYTITKESMSRTNRPFVNSTQIGLNSNYNDQFDLPQKMRPHEVPDLEPDAQNETDTEGTPTAQELRLTTNLAPIFYNLTVKVYVPGFIPLSEEKNMTFDGALIIKFKVLNATNKIELNAVNLHFSSKLDLYSLSQGAKRSKRAANSTANDQALIVSPTGTRPVSSADVSTESDTGNLARVDAGLKVTGIVLNETLEKVTFILDGELQPDQEYYFNIPYSGPIDQKLSGLYLTTYTDVEGKQKYAAVTQMEPTDARRFAPCFDEPAMKAVWRLRVLHPVGSKAASNSMEQRQDEPTSDPNWILTTFEESLPMSSYLLALFVSEFQYVEGRTKNNVRFRIWARKEALNETEYALQAGIKCLEFYEDYFNIPFPLAKQDMIALPDFSAGAMENWGLITYREKYLLYSPTLYSSRQKLHVATVVAHELAHQWFGNLVTMDWWNALWLNEGFATLMEYIGAAAISDGKFRMDEYFILDALTSAFDRDARATSHPLIFPIEKAEDVTEAFDSITYDKGGSVLRMIQEIMGEQNFRKGLTIYLNRFKFKNAKPDDLWDSLNEAIPKELIGWDGQKFDVHKFAELWTRQMGFPVVSVKRIDEHRVQLSQHRFKLDEEALENPKFRNPQFWYKWDIPVWSSVNGTESQMSWLHESTFMDVPEDTSLVVNTDSRGFYRVQYSKKTLDIINELLIRNHEQVSTKTRARIIDDAFTLAQAGKLSYEAALNLTFYLNKETEYLPWFTALSGLDTIQYYFGDEPELGEVREYTTALISGLYEKISWDTINTTNLDDNKFYENLLQVAIIVKMCTNRISECTDKLNSIYYNNFVYPCQNGQKMSSQCSSVPIPIRGLTYCEGIRSGSEKDWERMLEMYQRETVQVERERLLTALTCSHDAYTLKRLLAMTIDFNNTLIRLQDKPSVFDSVSGQEPIGQAIALEFFMDHWPQIYRDFKEQQSLLRSIIVGSIGGTSARTIEQVEKFLQQNQKTTKNLDAFKQRLEVLHTNRKWIDANLKPMSLWFKEQNQKRKRQKPN